MRIGELWTLKILLVRFCHLRLFKILVQAPYRYFFSYQLIADNIKLALSALGASICITLWYQKTSGPEEPSQA